MKFEIAAYERYFTIDYETFYCTYFDPKCPYNHYCLIKRKGEIQFVGPSTSNV